MTDSELERIKGRHESARDTSDQEGVSFWRALYQKDVGDLIQAVSPVEIPVIEKPMLVEKRYSLTSIEALLIDAGHGFSEVMANTVSALVIDQLVEGNGYLVRAHDCVLRASGKEA